MDIVMEFSKYTNILRAELLEPHPYTPEHRAVIDRMDAWGIGREAEGGVCISKVSEADNHALGVTCSTHIPLAGP